MNKLINKIITIVFIISFVRCTPFYKIPTKKTYAPLSKKDTVIIIHQEEPVPQGSVLIGKSKKPIETFYYDSGVSLSERYARKMGGNIVKISKWSFSENTFTIGYRQFFEIYYNPHLTDYLSDQRQKKDSIKLAKFGQNADYSILYIFPRLGGGGLIPYKIRLNNNPVCEVKTSTTYAIKLSKEGHAILSANTLFSKRDLLLNVKFGEEYYLHFGTDINGVSGSLIFWRVPYLSFLSNYIGEIEYKRATNGTIQPPLIETNSK